VIDAVILCGGVGSRLYPKTSSTPKALIQVGGRPIVDFVLQHLVRSGCRRVVLCAGFGVDDIREHVRSLGSTRKAPDLRELVVCVPGPAGESVELIVVDTGLGTPSGARMQQIGDLLSGDALIVYGDVLADVSIPDLLRTHRANNTPASLTITRVRSPFGHVDVAPSGIVRAMEEKPILASPVNIGYLILSPHARARLSTTSGQLERELLPQLATEGELSAYLHEGQFEPMDSVADWQRLERMWRDGRLDWLQHVMSSPAS
jgi:glucose-1-phosphate cytidylyltransferase